MSSRPNVLALTAALAVLLASCASASRIMISDARAPLPVEFVRVYLQPPPSRYIEIALLDASSGGFTYGAQNRDNAVMDRLRSEAAQLGANGVLIQQMGQLPSNGGVGVGVGGGSRHIGGGVSVDISPPRQTARALAIYIPDAPPH